jgi:hypothetical protein
MPRSLAALALAFLTALMVFASGAEAASQKLWNACTGKDAEAAIKACTQFWLAKIPRQIVLRPSFGTPQVTSTRATSIVPLPTTRAP